MIHKNAKLSDFHLLVWFIAFIFCSAIWGLLAGGIAYQYNIPFDFFTLFPGYGLFNGFILGMVYCSGIALGLVILEKLGAYNPVIAFVTLMAGIILFVDMLFGRTSLAQSQHQIWLLLVPVVIIRDIVTFFYLRDMYRYSDEIHEIDISCKIEEPDFAEITDSQQEGEEEASNEDKLAESNTTREYGNRHQYLRA